MRQVRERFPEKDIWCYTGYLFEDLAAGKVGEHGRALLEQLDMLVDGPFVIALKNLGLRFRGSSNQRIIEVRPSLERGSRCCGTRPPWNKKNRDGVQPSLFLCSGPGAQAAQGLGGQKEQGGQVGQGHEGVVQVHQLPQGETSETAPSTMHPRKTAR